MKPTLLFAAFALPALAATPTGMAVLTGVTIGLACAAWYALTTGRMTYGTLLVMLALAAAFLAVILLDGA